MKTIGKCALIYPQWYLKNLVGSIFDRFFKFDDQIARQLNWAERNTRRLALTLFHQMLLRGPKLEMRQLILARLVDIGAELAVMSLVASRLQTEKDRKDPNFAHNMTVMAHFFKSRRVVVERLFSEVWDNADLEATASANAVMDRAEILPQRSESDLPPMERKFCSDFTKGSVT